MNDASKAQHSAEKKADRVSDFLDGVKDQSGELLEAATERGQKLWDKAQDQGEDAWKDGKTWIAKHPGTAIAYAFVAGALAFAYLTRRED